MKVYGGERIHHSEEGYGYVRKVYGDKTADLIFGEMPYTIVDKRRLVTHVPFAAIRRASTHEQEERDKAKQKKLENLKRREEKYKLLMPRYEGENLVLRHEDSWIVCEPIRRAPEVGEHVYPRLSTTLDLSSNPFFRLPDSRQALSEYVDYHGLCGLYIHALWRGSPQIIGMYAPTGQVMVLHPYHKHLGPCLVIMKEYAFFQVPSFILCELDLPGVKKPPTSFYLDPFLAMSAGDQAHLACSTMLTEKEFLKY